MKTVKMKKIAAIAMAAGMAVSFGNFAKVAFVNS